MKRFFIRLEDMIARALLSLPHSLLRFLTGGKKQNESGHVLNAQIQAGLLLSRLKGKPEDYPPAITRKKISRLTGPFDLSAEPLARIENFTIPGPVEHRIWLRLYSSTDESALRPVVLFFHGGGFVIGDLNTNDSLLRLLALRTGYTVISVDYRLAPEHKYPAQYEDALQVYKWILQYGNEFGLNVNRLCLAGDSAGGNICLHIAMNAKKKRWKQPSLLALIYPWVDLSDSAITDESMIEMASGFGLTGSMLDYFRRHAFDFSIDLKNSNISPIYAKESVLKKLPPVYIQVCGFDPLRDQGIRMADRINQSGGHAQVVLYESLIHGSIGIAGTVTEAKKMISDYIETIKDLL